MGCADWILLPTFINVIAYYSVWPWTWHFCLQSKGSQLSTNKLPFHPSSCPTTSAFFQRRCLLIYITNFSPQLRQQTLSSWFLKLCLQYKLLITSTSYFRIFQPKSGCLCSVFPSSLCNDTIRSWTLPNCKHSTSECYNKRSQIEAKLERICIKILQSI